MLTPYNLVRYPEVDMLTAKIVDKARLDLRASLAEAFAYGVDVSFRRLAEYNPSAELVIEAQRIVADLHYRYAHMLEKVGDEETVKRMEAFVKRDDI